MRAKVNLVLLAVLVACWGATSLAEPAASLDPAAPATARLASLEDAFAADHSDAGAARQLADEYLARSRPRLAVSVLSAAPAALREDPAILHRLARGYEETGRIDDALATARLARARCARALGTADASTVTPVPSTGCSERTYAALDMHVGALTHMQRWGVTDVQHDDRARQAYIRAVRSARIVSASR